MNVVANSLEFFGLEQKVLLYKHETYMDFTYNFKYMDDDVSVVYSLFAYTSAFI